MYAYQGRYAEAEPLYKRALAIFEKALPDRDPRIAVSLSNLANLNASVGKDVEALELARRASAIVARGNQVSTRTGASGEIAQYRWILKQHARLIAKVAQREPKVAASLEDEAFWVQQQIQDSLTAQVLAQSAARLAAGTPALAEAVRTLQDLQNQSKAMDKQLSRALGNGDKHLASAARSRMTVLDTQIDGLVERIRREFPRYDELARARPVSIAEVQGVLRPEEALVTFIETYLFIVRACLYRLALTGFLDLHFNVATTPADQTEAVAQFINQRMEFMKFQCAYESAIATAI